MDLPVWQGLYDELRDENFVVIAVAMDSRGDEAARPWIEQSQATYPCLIDQEHRVAALYNMVNVPQAVWIDEEGRIVRPTEVAGTNDAFRAMDRTKFTIPDEEAARLRHDRGVYLDALRDWVRNGPASEFVWDEDDARRRVALPDASVAEANAAFRLGQHLRRAGNESEGDAFLQHAINLRPESWNFWRQTADLEEVGKSGGPEFWARVDALGKDKYYAPVDMEGMSGG